MKKSIIAVLAASAALLSLSAQAHYREGMELVSSADQWTWTEHKDDGSTLLSETGTMPQAGARFTFSTHQDTVFHTFSLKGSSGSLQYSGSYLNGPAVQTTTRYQTFKFEYAVAAPLPLIGHGVEWTAGIGYEERNRSIWNPSSSKDQNEAYGSGVLRVGVQLPRPKELGFYGSAGLNLNILTDENPYTTALGFKTAERLSPTSDVGASLMAGFAVNRSFSVEVSHELMRFGRSDAVILQDSAGKSVQIWQPRSTLGRTSVQAVYKF